MNSRERADRPTDGAIQPIVLVGGLSSRFGRDKLVEPVGGRPLVCAAIDALASALDRPVCLVGQCGPAVRRLAGLWIPDRGESCGPMGGIYSALVHFGCDVFVLPGDLPSITAEAVRAILAAAEAGPDAEAVLACAGGRPGGTRSVGSAGGPGVPGHDEAWPSGGGREPCIGVYRLAMREVLGEAIGRGEFALFRLLAGRKVIDVPLAAELCRNVNRPQDLPGGPRPRSEP